MKASRRRSEGGIFNLFFRYCVLIACQVFVAANEHYAINYGDGLGEANININHNTHMATITPSTSTTPTTLISFKKSLVVYVSNKECMVSPLKENESDYTLHLNHIVNRINGTKTLYAMGDITPNRVRKFLGEDLFPWCAGKPTIRLGKRKPKIPTNIFSLKDMLPNDLTHQEHSLKGISQELVHHRSKRRAKKRKNSKRRKDKTKKDKKKKGKKSKSKKGKKPKTKSLRNSRAQKLNIIAPRVSFPLPSIPQNLTDPSITQELGDHVVLQEEPYLSPSFTRSDDDGQRFRHYNDFYQESIDNHSQGATHRIISHDMSDPIDGESISIPETIVKDGQIFYRYDADENNAAEKGQSKRSHRKDQDTTHDSDHIEDIQEIFEYPDDPEDHLDQDSPSTIDPDHISSSGTHTESKNVDSGRMRQDFETEIQSHIQTQAQMKDDMRGATAEASSGNGYGSEVFGNTGSTGFFIAQAHSRGRQGKEMNHAHVFGNTHGVIGSAMASGQKHQSHVQVDMGAHPSSTAHVTSHGGSNSLSAGIFATQLGGKAGASAYGDGASTSNAQMEFNPIQQYGSGSGIRGQGSASAIVSNLGSSLSTSLSGDVSRGSYLGTAHSSLQNILGRTFPNENISNSFSRERTGIEQINQSSPQVSKSSKESYENPPHRRKESDRTYHGIDHFGDTGHDNFVPQTSVAGQNPFAHSDDGQIIGDIMETVHQPQMQHEIIPYPLSDFNIIDHGGLTVGAGIPPRESEIEQAPIVSSGDIQEGIGLIPGHANKGLVGLATYSHGDLGAPPGPGELLGKGGSEFSQYDYGYYDNRYDSEYYNENYVELQPQGPDNPPFFDLGPEIVDFEPIESNFENMRPIQLGAPSQEIPNYEYAPEDITPDPPITVHQVQAPTLLPEETSSDHDSRSEVTYDSHVHVPASQESESTGHIHIAGPLIDEELDNYNITPVINLYEDRPAIDYDPSQDYQGGHDLYEGGSISHSFDRELHDYTDEEGSISSSYDRESHDYKHNEGSISQSYDYKYDEGPVSQSHDYKYDEGSISHSHDYKHNEGRISPSYDRESQDRELHDYNLYDRDSHDYEYERPISHSQDRESHDYNLYDEEHILHSPDRESHDYDLPFNPPVYGHESRFHSGSVSSQSLTEQPLISNTPTREPGVRISEFDNRKQPPVSSPHNTSQDLQASNVPNEQQVHHRQESITSQEHLQPTTQQPLQNLPVVNIQQQSSTGTMMMMGVPLNPGDPGSVRTLPGQQGRPDLKILSLAAPGAGGETSVARRRGRYLQPGEKIPGAPGYKVPTGFRGRVVLEDNFQGQTGSSAGRQAYGGSSMAARGFNSQINQRQSPSRISMQSQPMPSSSQQFSGPTLTTSRHRTDNSQNGKSWDGRQHSRVTPQRSYGVDFQGHGPTSHRTQGTSDGDDCGYYSMDCDTVYGPHEQSNICKPILITIGCCC